MTYNVAIVGATGAVGREMLQTLSERNFPINNIYALALFLFHNLTYLYILKLNNTSKKEISTIFKILKEKTLVDLK